MFLLLALRSKGEEKMDTTLREWAEGKEGQEELVERLMVMLQYVECCLDPTA